MAQKLATPGVYVEEKNAFPSSVVAVSTAVPAFIGYTEKVTSNGQSLVNTPVRISSLSEFINMFGEGFKSNFAIEETTGEGFDFEVDGKTYDVVPENASRFLLYDSIRLFFANGGNVCYIVSAGSFYKKVQVQKSTTGKDDKGKATVEKTTQTENKPAAISKKALEAALQTLVGEQEPTMVVIPEAVMLERQDCAALQQAMLQHCGTELKNRFAILDVYEGHKPRTYDSKDVVTAFREDIGNNFLNFGAAYYPWVRTSVVQSDELDYTNISNADMLIDLLEKEAKERFQDSKKVDEIKNEVKKMKDSSTDVESLHQTLNAISSVYKSVLNSIRKQLNILPPSAGMAGVYTMVDSTRGVWKAPANVGYNSVVTPAVKITNQDQEDLNVTVSGKSVNAIRAFAGEGILVWGARTLEGNSKDWRYVNVRRTISFIEQSIKAAARTYVFEPNAASTWLLIRGMVNAFLSDLWTQGALVGTTPEQAYEVHVGLGSTMTTDDILDGIMRITVKVAVSRPAEFIVITFQQKMEEA